MDIAQYLSSRNQPTYRQDKVVVVQIEKDSPLADPERPGYVEDRHVANSLLNHLERSLVNGKEPALNPMWHELASTAANVRNRQEAREQAVAVRVNKFQKDEGTAIEVGDETLERLVEADVKRASFYEALDALVPASRRTEVREAVEANVMKQAFTPGARGEEPAVEVDGFDLVWRGREGRAYQSAMLRLSHGAKANAEGRNAEIEMENQDRDPDEKKALVNPRDTMRGWIASMNSSTRKVDRPREEYYDVVMTTDAESVVMKGFLDIALKAHDARKTPSAQELKDDVAALREHLSTPEYKLKSELVPLDRVESGTSRTYRPQARDSAPLSNPAASAGRDTSDEVGKGAPPVMRSALKAFVVRPAIAPNGLDYKKVENFGIMPTSEATPEIVHAALRQRTPIVGFEGQRNYHSDEVVTRELDALTRVRKDAPMIVSHAPEGSEFRASLLRAAEKLGVPVIQTQLKLSRVQVNTDTGATIENFDGNFAAPMNKRMDTRATCTVDVRFNERDAWTKADLTSATARAAMHGRIVLIDTVGTKAAGGEEDKRLFQATINHAALIPNKIIGFGIERHDQFFGRLYSRRELSGLEPPAVYDKKGNLVQPAEAAKALAAAGKTAHQGRAEAATLNTAGLSLKAPAGQSVAIAMIGAEKAGHLMGGFRTLGDAVQVARQIERNPKSAGDIAATLSIGIEALRAAKAYETATRDTERLGIAAAQAKNALTATTEAGTTILANPTDRMVAKFGPLVGFSSIRDDSGALKSDVKTVALIGDPRPASPALERNIGVAVAALAERAGRDDDGRAKLRLVTTLTEGTGEAVMKAALEHKVPIEVIGHKDDRLFRKDTPELRLYALANTIEEKGLGGTWSASSLQPKLGDALPEAAARIAMEAADATIVTQIGRRSPLSVTVAAAAQTKSTLVMPASDPDARAYDGNRLLATKDQTVSATFDRNGRMAARMLENATYAPSRTDTGAGVLFATVDTKAGAQKLQSATDMGPVMAAAEGRLDASMSRPRPKSEMGFAEANRTGARMDVLGAVDLDRIQEAGYRKRLDLTPVEERIVSNMRLSYVQNNAMVGRTSYESLKEKWGIVERPRARERDQDHGHGR